MADQRPAFSAPVVRARAEALPFEDRSFDVVMAVLTVHHWDDRDAGLAELARVAPRRVVVTFDPVVHGAMWLMDYLPEIDELERRRAPAIAEIVEHIEGTDVIVLPVPWDCVDGMTIAYWRRPHEYLNHHIHAGGSGLRQIERSALDRGLAHLESDLESGRWESRYGDLLELQELDCGLRIIVRQAPD